MHRHPLIHGEPGFHQPNLGQRSRHLLRHHKLLQTPSKVRSAVRHQPGVGPEVLLLPAQNEHFHAQKPRSDQKFRCSVLLPLLRENFAEVQEQEQLFRLDQ